MKKQWLAAVLAVILIWSCCVSPCFAVATEDAEMQTRATVSQGVKNIVKRAYQMTNIKWTPKADIAGWGNGLTYKKGTTYTGLPYGQPVYADYVPWETSLSEFIDYVNDSSSYMYTKQSTYNKVAPYYSIDCSAFVSWAWGLESRQTTQTIKNFATQISTSSYKNAEIGDCLCLAGSHVVLITDIAYDSTGAINSIEISESTVITATNFCCQKTRYGVGGSYTLDELTSKYFGAGYILYRCKTRDSVTYSHCCDVPLDGDTCQQCNVGTTNHDPVIMLDRWGSPSEGRLYVRGWAYDPDSPNEKVNIHIYFGDDCVYGGLYTGVSRPDVPEAGYPCGPNQGFEAVINTDKYGTKLVRAFAINIGAGTTNTMAVATPDVTIPKDTKTPALSNPKVTNVTSTSYTITVDATDNIQIREVKMPSWVTGQSGNDAVWHQASQIGTDTYSCTIPRVAGKTTHWTHVYAYDIAGNSAAREVRLDEVKVSFNANGGSCSTSSKTVTAIAVFDEFKNPYGTLPTPTRTNYTFDGWYTAASGGTKVTASTILSNRSAHTLYAHWTAVKYNLDLNGQLDGGRVTNINGYGVVDVYVNGTLVAEGVSDFCTGYPVGTKYEIKNIRPNKGVSYNGFYSGTRTGTVGNAKVDLMLSFNKIVPAEFTETPAATVTLDGHVYEFYNSPVTWYTARDVCEYKGGHLVAITSARENAMLAAHFGDAALWIGATDEEKEGTFTWPTGEAFTYSDWYTGEPGNMWGDNDDRESYVIMRAKGQHWSDFNGTFKFGFICEYETCSHKYEDSVVSPTCTAQGFTLHTCTVCGQSYKDNYTDKIAHVYSYAVTEKPTLSTIGSILGTCSRCFGTITVSMPNLNETEYTKTVMKEATCTDAGTDSYRWNVTDYGTYTFTASTAALGHSYSTNITPPTCTAQGFTTYTCSRCTDSYKDNYTNATGHSYSYTDKGENHEAVCSGCFDSFTEEHSYTENICVCGDEEVLAPITDEAIVINHSLNLASDISINYAVMESLLAGYDSFRMEVQVPVYNGGALTGFKTVTIDPVRNGSYYYFTMTDVTAVNMNDELVATLRMYKGKQEYVSKPDSYSIVTYALNQLNKANASATLKTLCADLLRYGAAAQSFKDYRTDALATTAMTAEHKSFLSDISKVTFGNTNTVYNDLTNPMITWVGKTLNLGSKVVVKFIFDAGAYTGDISNLTLRLVYRDYSGVYQTKTLTNPTAYNEAKRQYSFEFDGLMAAELRTAVSAAVYAGNVQLSQTLQYSPDTYGNNKTGTLGELCKALIAYSDSAKKYFA